jgi:hypothetical protein
MQKRLQGVVDVLVYTCSFISGSILGKVILYVVALAIAS